MEETCTILKKLLHYVYLCKSHYNEALNKSLTERRSRGFLMHLMSSTALRWLCFSMLYFSRYSSSSSEFFWHHNLGRFEALLELAREMCSDVFSQKHIDLLQGQSASCLSDNRLLSFLFTGTLCRVHAGWGTWMRREVCILSPILFWSGGRQWGA